jgi:glycosyltransferase involved in cell wall biosynthesis
MKIAIITTSGRDLLKRWDNTAPGLGTAVEALLQGFRQLPEHEVHVLMPVRRNVQPGWQDGNLHYHEIFTPMWGMMKSLYFGASRAVKRKLQEIQPDIVHGQGTERECAISAARSGQPNVVTIHGNMAELARRFGARPGSFGWLAARLESHALRRTAGVFCNSGYTENLVRPRTPRVWRVANALREDFFAPAAPGGSARAVLLNVGVISPRKRQVEILGVVERLRQQGLDFELRFIGAMDPADIYAKRFLERIKPLEAQGCARYLGSQPTPELICSFDAAQGLVHFPSEEAFGLVVAEALARELKFFGASLGGIVDIAAGAPGAELFAGDDWSGLMAGIAAWVQAGHPRARGAEALMRAHYHPRVIAQRHVEIYEEVLKTFS